MGQELRMFYCPKARREWQCLWCSARAGQAISYKWHCSQPVLSPLRQSSPSGPGVGDSLGTGCRRDGMTWRRHQQHLPSCIYESLKTLSFHLYFRSLDFLHISWTNVWFISVLSLKKSKTAALLGRGIYHVRPEVTCLKAKSKQVVSLSWESRYTRSGAWSSRTMVNRDSERFWMQFFPMIPRSVFLLSP